MTAVSWMPLHLVVILPWLTTRRHTAWATNMGSQYTARSSQLHANTGTANTAKSSGESR